ncbi:MAG: hypothetical protein E7001_01560 [Coriobacteriaceae bacterium]|nr:hypothetical protein [Coriobacteriaceae bacterium]
MRRSRRERPSAARWGVDLFVEDGAYTTVTAAVSLLAVLALAFSAATAVWTLSRAGDAQVAADSTALAGANVVSSYYTAATVVDASILSLGLTGLAVTGVGMVGMLVPGVGAAAGEAVDAGIRILKTRNDFATSASRGLGSLEEALPYLVAANGTRVCAAQGTDRARFSGTALAVPWESDSNFPALEGEQIPVDGLEEAAADLEEAARELSRAAEKSEADKRRAWIADCGREGMNMQERAARLSGLTAAQNPDYASSITWDPAVGLDRARAYYRWRRDHDAPTGSDVESRADAAARHAFYRFACEELERAHVREIDGRIEADLPLLPRNTDEVRRSRLYTEAVWPSSEEGGGLTLHFDASCPGALGPAGRPLSLAAVEAGQARACAVCSFDVGDVGKAPAASTSIDNGFEYHLREFTEALRDYVSSRNRELELERKAQGRAQAAGGSFEDALAALVGKRPRIAPPGREGCVAVAVSGELPAPDQMDTAFSAPSTLPGRGAISAAVLSRDPATKENNALGSFFSSLEGRTGSSVIGVLGDVMDLWGSLLVSYGDLSDGLDSIAAEAFRGLDLVGAGPVARWLGDRVRSAMTAIGIDPVDLSYRKPVLADSSRVIAASDLDGVAEAQARLRSIPLGTTDPGAILAALGYEVRERILGAEVVIAEIPLPGGGSVPLTIRLRDVMGGT